VQAGHDVIESSDSDCLLDTMRDGILTATCNHFLDIRFRNMYLHASFLGDDLPYRLKGLNSGYDKLGLSLVWFGSRDWLDWHKDPVYARTSMSIDVWIHSRIQLHCTSLMIPERGSWYDGR
jgi:hypothetical protein